MLQYRTTRRLALTEAGTTYLARARQILVDVAEADAQAGTGTTDPRGELDVLAPPAFAVHQLAPRLGAFRAQYPDIRLTIHATGPVDSLDERVDVSILSVARELAHGDFVARRLAHSTFVVCASPAYLERRGRPRTPADLLTHDALLPAVAALRRELTLFPVHMARGKPPGPVTLPVPCATLASAHIETLHAAALAGLGITGLPSFVVADDLQRGALERVLPQWRGTILSLYAAMPARKHAPARTRAFVEFLVQTFGGAARDPWLRGAPA